jgi:hypothetical protein
MGSNIKKTMKDFERYLLAEGRYQSLSENKKDQLQKKLQDISNEIARLEAAKEPHRRDILKSKMEVSRIDKAQDTLRTEKRALKDRFNIEESEVIDEDVPACGKPGNPSKGSDGKFSSYSDRASQSRFYSCGDDRESKAGSKSSTCGRSDPKRKEKCKD